LRKRLLITTLTTGWRQRLELFDEFELFRFAGDFREIKANRPLPCRASALPLEPNLEMRNNKRCRMRLMQRETITDRFKYAHCTESKIFIKEKFGIIALVV